MDIPPKDIRAQARLMDKISGFLDNKEHPFVHSISPNAKPSAMAVLFFEKKKIHSNILIIGINSFVS